MSMTFHYQRDTAAAICHQRYDIRHTLHDAASLHAGFAGYAILRYRQPRCREPLYDTYVTTYIN